MYANPLYLFSCFELRYEHLGIVETYASGDIEVKYKAEVGLLTHNIKFRGYNDPQWHDTIEACPDGFDTGRYLVTLQISSWQKWPKMLEPHSTDVFIT